MVRRSHTLLRYLIAADELCHCRFHRVLNTYWLRFMPMGPTAGFIIADDTARDYQHLPLTISGGCRYSGFYYEKFRISAAATELLQTRVTADWPRLIYLMARVATLILQRRQYLYYAMRQAHCLRWHCLLRLGCALRATLFISRRHFDER